VTLVEVPSADPGRRTGVKVCVACGSASVDDDWTCADCGHRPSVVDGFTAFAPSLATENEGFHADYFAELAALEPSSFWFGARNELILWALATYFPAARRIMEIGSGTGYVLSGIRRAFPAAELHGSEIFAAGLGFAAERVPSATLYQMDARHIPFRGHFDVIGAFDVLEHIEDDVAVLEEIARALRPGGGFIASVPQHPALWSPQDDHAFHVRRYTSRELRRKAEAAGFEVLRMTSFVSLLLPMLFLSRARMPEDRPGGEVDAMGDLRQPRAVNVMLGAVMMLERRLIKAGLSFPAGGSLLLVCRTPARSGTQA
jgi:SAM-dependent methyltransferase